MSRQSAGLLEEFRQSWRTTLIVAVVSCLLGATTGFGYVQLRFIGVTGSPTETVQRYLLAIAQNDSVRALQEVAHRPADTSLLTDEALRSAHLDNPMSGIAVTQTRSPRVPVSFLLGTTRVETVITVTAVEGVFLVDQGLATADLTQARSLGVGIQAGGRGVTADAVPVFPGIYPVTTGDSRLALKPGGYVKAVDVGGTAAPPAQELALTDSGLTSIRGAAQAQIAACAEVSNPAPAGCPFSADDSTTYRSGTATWVSLSDPSVSAEVVAEASADITVSGRMRFTAVVAATGKNHSEQVSFTSPGKVDLRNRDWRITWE
ncbi:hypothetical protein [Propionicicella superfundia]|uniref:hypothetical protein n=1 Tax=Propionicicella superfundia TaxID=348582 RepID=UPI00042770C9|nr:hypothetical protein [Propionicicella superfundia]